MKTKFYNRDLQTHIERIVDNYKRNPENLTDLDMLPGTWFTPNDGEGNPVWNLSVPNIEESYFYRNKKELDSDFKKLNEVIVVLKKNNL